MAKRFLIFLFIGTSIVASAQSKRIWAKSFLHKKSPEIIVDTWLTDKPDTDGKFVLIDFWATWCAPCRRFIPDLNYYQEKFKKDLVVIGLSNQNPRVLESYYNKIKYYHGTDPQKRTYKKYRVTGIPHTVLIDPDGYVQWEGYPMLEGYELTEEIIENSINSYRKKHKK